jgi:hypothetical protein
LLTDIGKVVKVRMASITKTTLMASTANNFLLEDF